MPTVYDIYITGTQKSHVSTNFSTVTSCIKYLQYCSCPGVC